MANHLLLTTSLLAFSIALTGCGGGSSTDAPSTSSTSTPKKLNLTGKVVDDKGQPLSGVAISIGSQNITSNTQGQFSIALNSSEQNLTVLFKKAGFLTTARQIPVIELTGQALTLNISLNPDQINQTFASATGITNLAVAEANVSIPANAIVRADGSAFAGNVHIAANYYNPDSLVGAQAFAQPFAGENPNGSNRTGLITVGVVEVKLTDPATGEKLQLKAGQSATLTFPASSTAQDLATIPLWYYDETKKIWIKEGQVTKQSDGRYQGSVTHFTLWNVDIPVENGATVTGCFEDEKTKKRLQYFYASLEGRGFSTSGGVGSTGQFTAVVPANTPLTLNNVIATFGTFTPVNIPSLAPNQKYQINAGKCIAVSTPEAGVLPILSLPFPALPPVPTPPTPTPTPTPTGEVIGYNFQFVPNDDNTALADIVLMTLRLAQNNGNSSISFTGTSLYGKPVNFGGSAQYTTYSLTNQGIVPSSETRIVNGLYQQTMYGTSFANNQYTQRLSNGYNTRTSLNNRSIAGQNIVDRLTTDDFSHIPDFVEEEFNKLPTNQRTFTSNTNCLMTASSSTTMDAIEFDTTFSTPMIGGSFTAFANLMIPDNQILGTWNTIPWVASTQRDEDNYSVAYVQYQNSIYSGSYEFAGSTSATDECIWYDETTKDQVISLIRRAYPTL